MGNQLSTTGYRKSGLPVGDRKSPTPSEQERSLSQQDTLKPPSSIRRKFSKLKLSLSGVSPSSRNASSRNTSSASTPDAASIQERRQLTSTDGASTPMDETFDIVLPAPSQITDAQYLSLSLDTVSPSEASTVTQGLLNPPSSVPWRTSTPAPSDLTSSKRSSSYTSSTPRFPSRPPSISGSPGFRSHPLFPATPLPPQKILAPPLLPVHYACYQAHRRMLRSANAKHPVPCMACGVEDEQVRHKCVWCCLRICGACMDRLDKVERRDLKVLVPSSGRRIRWGRVSGGGHSHDSNNSEGKAVDPMNADDASKTEKKAKPS